MKENGLTIKQLADIIGVSDSWLGGVINLKVIPKRLDGDGVKKLLKYFGLEFSDLFPSESLKIIAGEHQISKEIPKDKLIQWSNDKFNNLPAIEYKEDFLYEKMEKALNTLSPTEKEVLKLRFGLFGCERKTLKVIAKMFGVTRERIRQIELKAMRRLKHPSRSNILKDCL
jgi:RNA polymerase sigma factor (sigma-70 family)